MKKISFLAIAAIALAAFACNRAPKSIADIKDATAADSMMYYFGIMQANNYLQDAESDTVLKTEEGRRQFMEGFRAAMKMEHDNPSYNKGLQLGLRLAIRLQEFSRRYGMDFPEDILAASFENAMTNDSDLSVRDAQLGFYLIKDRLDMIKKINDVEDAKAILAKTAIGQGYVMLSDTLYAKDVTPPGSGRLLRDGDRVAVKISGATADGRSLEGRQFPDTITVGEGRAPQVMWLGMHTMTAGQTRVFMTTPRTLFGNRYRTYGVHHDEPVTFTISIQ